MNAEMLFAGFLLKPEDTVFDVIGIERIHLIHAIFCNKFKNTIFPKQLKIDIGHWTLKCA